MADQIQSENKQSSVSSLADRATAVACKMMRTGLEARQSRFSVIRKNEDMYNGVNKPAMKGRSNIPFDSVVMGGFIDTLIANVEEPVSVKYSPTREQDKKAAEKVTAVWLRESGADKADWESKVRDSKKLAAVSGRGILKSVIGNVPKFKANIEVVDHYDFITEPQGGADLDAHLFKMQMNIFRTKQYLTENADKGFYDKTQVRKLVVKYTTDPEGFKENTDIYKNKEARFASFGMQSETENYVGQDLYRLVEAVIQYEGRWYYMVFSYEAGTWIRFAPLEEVFEHAEQYPGRGPWTSWATHRDPFVFWSKAPADDVRPIAYTMKKVVNYTVDNLEKRNWDQRAYDPKMFTDPTQLLWRQDGLVRATIKPGQDLTRGIFQFQTPDTTNITINLVEWLDNFLGQKSGITPDAQGRATTDKATISVNNLEQVSKRLLLVNKMFRKSIVDMAVAFDYGCYEYLREAYAVKLIGLRGVEWEEEVTRKDTECEFAITIQSGIEAEKENLLKTQKRELAFQRIEKNPGLMAKINQDKYAREILASGDYDEAEIREWLDVNSSGDPYLMAEAAQAIQDIIEGKKPRINRGANTDFIRKIIEFGYDNEVAMPVFNKLEAYAQAHVQIAQKNMERKMVAVLAKQMLSGGMPAMPGGAGAPANPSNPMPEETPAPMQ